MADRLTELSQAFAKELGLMGLHVQSIKPMVGVVQDPQVDDEGNVTPVPRVDLQSSSDYEGDLIQGVKDGNVHYGLDVFCYANQLAWTDRILYPEQYAMETEAEILLGDEDDVIAAFIQSELEAGKEMKDIRIPPELL